MNKVLSREKNTALYGQGRDLASHSTIVFEQTGF